VIFRDGQETHRALTANGMIDKRIRLPLNAAKTRRAQAGLGPLRPKLQEGNEDDDNEQAAVTAQNATYQRDNNRQGACRLKMP
jgi:hypothetical protein